MTSDISSRAAGQDPETTSDISAPVAGGTKPGDRRRRATPVPERFAEVFATYEKAVTAPGSIDPCSARAYLSRVRQFLAWLDEAAEWGDLGGDPLADTGARDAALRDYRKFMLTTARRKPSTVNAHFDAVNDLYRRRGLGPAKAKRQNPPHTAPRALPARALTRFQRAAERATCRDRALAYCELYGGLRGGEVVALNVDDIPMSARKGTVIVRFGKGGTYRTVPMHPKLREALEGWLAERRHWPNGSGGPALFLSARGKRLTSRAAYDVLTGIAEDAGLEVGVDAEFTPHVLRHQAGTEMVRSGIDLVTVAEIMGHSLEVARRYSLPTEDDKLAAIMTIPVDE